MLKDTADAKFAFHPHEKLAWDDAIVCVFADSSFANTK